MSKNIIPDPTQSGVSTDAQSRRPAWSDPALDVVDDGNQHPYDNITWVNSAPVDEWTVVTDEEGRTFTGREPARVALQGIRHHVEGFDFNDDHIIVTGDLTPGIDVMHGLELTAPTARRLALALLKAAQLLDPDHTWRGVRPSHVGPIVGEYRLNGDVIESYQSHADEWRGCCTLNGLVEEAKR
ncbi:hypothetical protein [Janibacter indicus]|uniref:hypothetical protein n=1 Tax=Janibacter indicus TaxID=857417 RepID=UPI003D9A7F70